MQREVVAVAALVWAVPVIALGQPAPEPTVPRAPAPAPPPAVDESRLRELVDREVARILTERAVKEAAERASQEAGEREAAARDASEVEGASGFMDTRLAFTLTNENMLVKPGETTPSVPGWRFGTPNSLGVLFFDGYDTRYSGFETMSHAVMYRSFARGRLQVEGSLVLRLDDLTENTINLADDGSYLTVSHWLDPTHKDPSRLSFTAFPVSSDRFRLGYSYRLSWGGNPEYRRAAGPKPGFKLQSDGAHSYIFVGMKSAVVTDPQDGEDKATFGYLLGAGWDVLPMLRLELDAGYFNRGNNPAQGVQDERVELFGTSAQVSLHRGMPLGSSVDYQLYKFNNESISGLFAPEPYPGGTSWLVQGEFTVLGQTLRKPGSTRTVSAQVGMAGDLNVRVKLDRIRLRLDLSYRDLAFIMHSTPGLPAYEGFPPGSRTTADAFAAIGIDNNWGDWLTLGVVAGLEKPATFTSPLGIPGTETEGRGTFTAVIRDNNVDTLLTILPPGESAVPQLAVKTTARADFARIFSALLEVFYSHDGNQTRGRRSCDNPAMCPVEYEFGQFNQLGLNATLQARF